MPDTNNTSQSNNNGLLSWISSNIPQSVKDSKLTYVIVLLLLALFAFFNSPIAPTVVSMIQNHIGVTKTSDKLENKNSQAVLNNTVNSETLEKLMEIQSSITKLQQTLSNNTTNKEQTVICGVWWSWCQA